MNASVWLSASRQRPGVFGESRGRCEPNTSATGFENVSSIWPAGEMREPGAGLTTIIDPAEAGNHATLTGRPSRSQERAASATSAEPVSVRYPRLTESAAWSSVRRVGSPPLL